MTSAAFARSPDDAFLLRYTLDPGVPIAPALLSARDRLATAAQRFLTVPDEVMDKPWAWREDDPDGESEIRYAFYRATEALDEAAHAIAAGVRGSGVSGRPAQPSFAAAAAARWELHGALAPLDDADLDRHPGGEEWTLRETLAHIVETQRAYSWFTSWWISRRAEPDFPPRVPEEVAAELPGEESEGAGTLTEIRARLDAILDLSAERMAGLDAESLAARARWSGYAVPAAFRIGRMASHIREHTVQVDKTLGMLGRTPTEAERLVRLIHAAHGRMEAAAFALPGIEDVIAEPVGSAMSEIDDLSERASRRVTHPET